MSQQMSYQMSQELVSGSQPLMAEGQMRGSSRGRKCMGLLNAAYMAQGSALAPYCHRIICSSQKLAKRAT
jgi:hypothetical protein